MPYDIDDVAHTGGSGGSSSGGGGGEQAFTSWSRREGMDPIVAGPHWEEVKQKLEAAGVDFWWDPRQEEQNEDKREPEARAAPVMLEEGQDWAGAGAGVEVDQKKSGFAVSGDGDGESGENREGKNLDEGNDARGDNSSRVRGGKIGAWRGAVAAAGQVRPPPPPPPPPLLEGKGKSLAEAAAVAAAVAAAEGGGGGGRGGWRSWVYFTVLISCVGVGGVKCMGRRKNTKKRRGGAQRRQQVTEWSGNAFSTNTLSPIGGPKTTVAAATTTFGWTGPTSGKRHQV